MIKPLARQQEPVDQADVAAYVAELSGNLASIARQHGLDILGYILEMAKLEAENARLHSPPKERRGSSGQL